MARMLGKVTHEATQECPYGCGMAHGQHNSQGRRLLKRAARRTEKRQWLAEAGV